MIAAAVRYAALCGLVSSCAAPAAANEPGLSATFNVGAVVIDLCQVPNAYRTVGPHDLQRDAQCARPQPITYAKAQPVTIVTYAANGAVTAISLEF